MPRHEPEVERELTLSLKVRTFGTRNQARATAERIRRMLSVEMHQDIELSRVTMKEVK